MKRKAISCLLVLASVLTMTPSIPTLAAENQADKTVVNETLADENQADKTLTDETQSDGTSADGLQETNASGSKTAVVKYDQASSFTVTIPKSIVLDSNKTATYNVKVKGDILGNEIITVVPDATVTLNDANGKDPVTGTINQVKTEFLCNEITADDGCSTDGKITADSLTSGNWSGVFRFSIDVDKKIDAGLYDANGIMLCSWEESEINPEKNYVPYGGSPDYFIDAINSAYYVINKKYPSVINIVIPNNVSQIGNYAFANGSNGHSVYTVENVFIPNSVTKIGTMSFSYCENLKYVSISNNITSIGSKAFYICTSLTSVKYRGTVYDTKSELEAVLVANGVNVSADAFDKTALK